MIETYVQTDKALKLNYHLRKQSTVTYRHELALGSVPRHSEPLTPGYSRKAMFGQLIPPGEMQKM
ncbi:hypothetical protein T265_03595 [Opisthorchis viverrini]|uniref:Uncharacterized protein n=1 Tax=Opisthorchis viverrini TaxID=6198 RepID=A0A074ZS00_OPIVI|nr:hypothetical protein T265_03595 [Opisthorchis viverrini]KER29906.1 hypothetical protein T265_03595 [Opisthorchis viverrini]